MITFSDTALTISETLQTNAIVWVHSLPESEMGPTRRILEDLESLAIMDGFPVFEFSVDRGADLHQLFSELTAQARQGLHPILHVDAHGSPENGLLLAPSGESVGWPEVIELLRGLNVATENNLTSVFALCFGLHLYKEAALKRAVPAYFFAAPASKISVGFLEEHTLAFYREVNRTLNVTTAFEETLGRYMQSFHCQGLFFQALVRYIRSHCMGKRRSDRKERLVTEILQRDGITTPTNADLKEARRHIREALAADQSLIDHFAPSFLVGRNAAFSFADLNKVLRRK